MNAEQAKKLGYEVVRASEFEVGLVKNGQGIRTWWNESFPGSMPGLDHPKILEAVEVHERMNDIWKDHIEKHEERWREEKRL